MQTCYHEAFIKRLTLSKLQMSFSRLCICKLGLPVRTCAVVTRFLPRGSSVVLLLWFSFVLVITFK